MKVTGDDVRHIADLSRLALSPEEIGRLSTELSTIIEYVEQLNGVETAKVEATSHVLPLRNVLRDDRTTGSLSRDEALVNAPERAGDFYRVPRIID